MENWRRVFIVTIGFVEALIFSGCLFGWTSLVHILQQEGVYSHLCEVTIGNRSVDLIEANDIPSETYISIKHSNVAFESSTEFVLLPLQNEVKEFLEDVKEPMGAKGHLPCAAQHKKFSLVYTVAGIMFGLTAIGIGFSLDHLGLWFTRFSASFMTTTGFVLLAFTSKDKSWLLWPALNLIALGTNQLRLSSFQFANLFPEKRSTIILGYGAAYSISTVVFLIAQYIYYAGIPYKLIILALGGISMLTFPVTLLMPRMKVKDHVEEKARSNDLISKIPGEFHETEFRTLSLLHIGTNKEIPLKKSLLTISSALHLFWQFVNFFTLFFYSVSFNAWAYKTTNEPEKIAFYNEVSGLCQIIAPMFIPLAGFVTDTLTARASKHEDRLERMAGKLEAPVYVVFVSTIFGILVSICTMSTSKWGVYASLILVAIYRPLLVGSCASYIRLRFYPEHFNRLNGIYTTTVALLCFVQYPFFVWMFSGDAAFSQSHWISSILMVLSTLSPIHMMFRSFTRKFSKTYLKETEGW